MNEYGWILEVPKDIVYPPWNEHDTIYAISSDFGDQMKTQHLD